MDQGEERPFPPQKKHRKINTIFSLATIGTFLLAASVLAVFTHDEMRREAMIQADSLARFVLDKDQAARRHLAQVGRSSASQKAGGVSQRSAKQTTQHRDEPIQDIVPAVYAYHVISGSAANFEGTPDPNERNFLRFFAAHPALREHSGLIEAGGAPYLLFMQRVATPHPQRGTALAAAIVVRSLRIPLARAFRRTDRLSVAFYGGLLGILLLVSMTQWGITRYFLISPLRILRDKLIQIRHDGTLLGDRIPLFNSLEMNEMANALNGMSAKLRTNQIHLEELVGQRTVELKRLNEILEQDIAERKAVEKALSESEQRYRTLYQNTPVMVHSIDPHGRLVSVSNLWLETLGYRYEEVIGRKLTDFMTKDSQEYAETSTLPTFFRTGFAREVPYQMVKKNGAVLDVLISAISERDDQDRLLCSLAVVIDVTARKRAERKIHELAFYDSLTGLPNRTLLSDRLTQTIEQARRNRQKGAVLFLDIDRFKNINDSLGHHLGDTLLKWVAALLQDNARKVDTVARLGGDEFAIVLAGIDNEQSPAVFAQRVLDALSEPMQLGGCQTYTTCSIGIAIFPRDGESGETLIKNADTAMYAAKQEGKNRYRFFSEEMNANVIRRLQLETGLRRALQNDEFFLCYQPQVDLLTGRLAGVETLLRWRDPQGGVMLPGTFIPLAEETGLILSIDKWVLRHAFHQARAWHDWGFSDLHVAINISGCQFRQPHFIEQIDGLLSETGADPRKLELELTESLLMNHTPETINVLTQLKNKGFRLTIDDFGTGYSSLSYLKNLPIDRLKIDQSFVQSLPDDLTGAAIIQAIIVMARTLHLDVVAEGVETREQMEFLRIHQCQKMQGYCFSHPKTLEELTPLLENGEGLWRNITVANI